MRAGIAETARIDSKRRREIVSNFSVGSQKQITPQAVKGAMKLLEAAAAVRKK
jgi:hypothetical protein